MDWTEILYALICLLVIIVALGAVILNIYVYATYGNLPITEVPAWALPWFIGK